MDLANVPLLPLAGELLHRNSKVIGIHGLDNPLFLGIELLPGRRYRTW